MYTVESQSYNSKGKEALMQLLQYISGDVGLDAAHPVDASTDRRPVPALYDKVGRIWRGYGDAIRTLQ